VTRPWAAGLLALLAAAPAGAQLRAGGEFRVNAATTGEQGAPAVAADPSGRFVVVWETTAGPDGFDVLGQRYGSGGEALGGPFVVNTTTAGAQYEPSVAMDGRGSFTVAWSGPLPGGGGPGIFAQRFAADGSRRGGELRVSEATAGLAVKPVAAANAQGDVVVVWPADDDDGTLSVFGRRYDRAGAARGGAFRVNVTTTHEQRSPDVAVAADGGFVVVWQSEEQDGDGYGIFARHFSAAGLGGPEFQVNEDGEGEQLYGAVAAVAGCCRRSRRPAPCGGAS